MGQGISEILTFAIAVAISPVPIIAVILMLFSQRAKVNGPAFLLGWVVALAAVSTVVYVVAHDGNVRHELARRRTRSRGARSRSASGFLLLARRQWRKRPAPGARSTRCPSGWATVDTLSPLKAARARRRAGGGEPQEPHPHDGLRPPASPSSACRRATPSSPPSVFVGARQRDDRRARGLRARRRRRGPGRRSTRPRRGWGSTTPPS